MASFTFPIAFLLLFTSSSILTSQVLGKNLQANANGTIYLGTVGNKELFLSERTESDFLWANFFCGGNGYNLNGLASLETTEEIELVNHYFRVNFGEVASSIPLWTSGSSRLISTGTVGSCDGSQWSNGNPILSEITFPGQPGSGGSPSYLWHKCVKVQRTCFSFSQGNPCKWEGGHRYTTQLVWADCKDSMRFLCERKL